MIKSKISILVVNKLTPIIVLSIIILLFGCSITNKNRNLYNGVLPHNEVISLVLSDLIEKSYLDKNEALMLGIPRVSNNIYVQNFTLNKTTYLSKIFTGKSFPYFEYSLLIDSSFHKTDRNTNLILRSEYEYFRNVRNSKYKERLGLGISPILINDKKEMAIFVRYSTGYDIHEAQYSVFHKNGSWTIEFDHYLENPQIWIGREDEVIEALEKLRKNRLRN